MSHQTELELDLEPEPEPELEQSESAHEYLKRVGLAEWRPYLDKHLPANTKSVTLVRAITAEDLQRLGKSANMQLDSKVIGQVLDALRKPPHAQEFNDPEHQRFDSKAKRQVAPQVELAAWRRAEAEAQQLAEFAADCQRVIDANEPARSMGVLLTLQQNDQELRTKVEACRARIVLLQGGASLRPGHELMRIKSTPEQRERRAHCWHSRCKIGQKCRSKSGLRSLACLLSRLKSCSEQWKTLKVLTWKKWARGSCSDC